MSSEHNQDVPLSAEERDEHLRETEELIDAAEERVEARIAAEDAGKETSDEEGGAFEEGVAAADLVKPSPEKLQAILEGALLAWGRPLSIEQMGVMFIDTARPEKTEFREALETIAERWQGMGIELLEVASGWRAQVASSVANHVARLWEEKPTRYSRALLETLALIAYRQPITRGEIEEIRGVTVSSSILKTLQEREWIRSLGHKEVPGRPELLGTTKQFLDYFNLKSLDQLPTLMELRDMFPEEAPQEPATVTPIHPERMANTAETNADADAEEGAEEGAAEGTIPAAWAGLAEGEEDEGVVDEEALDVEIEALMETVRNVNIDLKPMPGSEEDAEAEAEVDPNPASAQN
jgi:segregation and condensation protein B